MLLVEETELSIYGAAIGGHGFKYVVSVSVIIVLSKILKLILQKQFVKYAKNMFGMSQLPMLN